jgi:hypothetical protein
MGTARRFIAVLVRLSELRLKNVERVALFGLRGNFAAESRGYSADGDESCQIQGKAAVIVSKHARKR